MVDIRPFHGIRYNPAIAGSLSDLLCPPYDVIPVPLQAELYKRSPYNAVRLERGLAFEDDCSSSDQYTRAAGAFASWQREGVVAQEANLSYYPLRHRFLSPAGRPLERWSITAAVRLEEFDRRVVLPHEETMKAPKEDRLLLTQACQANLSPVMALYRQGHENRITAALKKVAQEPPSLDVGYEEGQWLTQWVTSDHDFAEALQGTLKEVPLFIADGHHRYETALLYRNRQREQAGNWSSEEAYNYVMMTLIDFDDPGLLVLPYYRMVGGLTPSAFTALRNRLLEVFYATSFPEQPSTPEALDGAVATHGKGTLALGILGLEGEGPHLLMLQQAAATRTDALQNVEGWVLREEVLAPVLGEAAERYTTYTHDPREAWDLVSSGEQQLAFFLRPFPMDLFEAVVSMGKRLPPKSTYFHPKVPTGLVFHLLGGKP